MLSARTSAGIASWVSSLLDGWLKQLVMHLWLLVNGLGLANPSHTDLFKRVGMRTVRRQKIKPKVLGCNSSAGTKLVQTVA